MASRSELIRAEAVKRGLISKTEQRRDETIRRNELTRPSSIRAAKPEARFPKPEVSGFQKFTETVADLPLTQIAGSFLGEQIGLKQGAKLGARLGPVGAAVGAGVGGVAGLLIDKQTKDRETTGLEAGAEFGAGVIGVPLGGLTRRLARPARTLFEPFLSTLSTTAREVNKNLQRYGESLLFSQATTSKAFNVAENVARAALTSVSALENKLTRQAVATEKFADEILGFFKSRPRSDAEIGNLFVTSFAEKESFNKGIAEAAYTQLNKLVDDGNVVNYDNILKALPGKSQKAINLFNATVRNRKINIGRVPEARAGKGKFFGEPVSTSDQGISFLDAKKLRTDFLELGRRLKNRASPAISPTEFAEINTIIKAIDSQMEVAAKKNGILKQWRATDEQYKLFREDFHNEMISKLAKEDPSIVGRKVSQIQTPEDVFRMKRVISPEALKDVQAAYLADVAERASGITQGLEERGTRQLMGEKLKKIIKLDRREKAVRKALFGKDSALLEKNLSLLADQAFLIQTKQSSGLGGMAVQLAQARGLTALGAGGVGLLAGGPVAGLGVGGVVFLGPVGLQKLLMSKKGMALLLDGLSLETGTSEAARAVTRIAAFLAIPRSSLTPEEVLAPQQQARTQTRNPRLAVQQQKEVTNGSSN